MVRIKKFIFDQINVKQNNIDNFLSIRENYDTLFIWQYFPFIFILLNQVKTKTIILFMHYDEHIDS